MGILESLAKSSTNIQSSNPFVQAMSSSFQTDMSLVVEKKLGSVLRNHKIVSGDAASVIDASLDYFLNDSYGGPYSLDTTLLRSSASNKQFIPIILKTEHSYKSQAEFAFNTNKANQKQIPLYIIFDSTPESFSFSKSAEWSPKAVQGRPEPVQVFASSSPTTISITGDFFVSSKYEHIYKLKVSDYLMSLVTPSKYNYMPSPITVMIGSWKRFRAIVNSVNIEFKGPWNVTTELKSDRNIQDLDNQGIPTHAPYVFTATLSLTIVKEKNFVDFAEDIIDNDLYTKTDNMFIEDLQDIQDDNLILENIFSKHSFQYQQGYNQKQLQHPGPYNSWSNPDTTYIFKDGVIQESTKYTELNINTDFNMFEQSNLDRRRADLGIITNIVNTQFTKFLRGLF